MDPVKYCGIETQITRWESARTKIDAIREYCFENGSLRCDGRQRRIMLLLLYSRTPDRQSRTTNRECATSTENLLRRPRGGPKMMISTRRHGRVWTQRRRWRSPLRPYSVSPRPRQCAHARAGRRGQTVASARPAARHRRDAWTADDNTITNIVGRSPAPVRRVRRCAGYSRGGPGGYWRMRDRGIVVRWRYHKRLLGYILCDRGRRTHTARFAHTHTQVRLFRRPRPPSNKCAAFVVYQIIII